MPRRPAPLPRVEERPSTDDLAPAPRLRARDEAAFTSLVDSLGPSMLRVARMYVSTQDVAEEVVQEAWLGVVQGIGRFEGRSSLRTWIIRIVVNIAKTRGKREARSVPFATLAGDDLDVPSFDPSVFQGPEGDHPPLGHPARRLAGLPEERLLGAETLEVVSEAIAGLPPMQAEVIRLRDVLGWSADEVRNALGIK